MIRSDDGVGGRMQSPMQGRESGGMPRRRRLDPAAFIAAFPGAVALAYNPPTGSAPGVLFESDGQPWAVQVVYAGPGDERLVVRTVRPRGEGALPTTNVEDLGSWVRAFSYGAFGPKPVEPDSLTEWQAWQADRMATWQEVRTDFDRLDRAAVSMLVDGAPVAGSRVDVPGCTGIELDWGASTVYCVGRAPVIDALELRTGTGRDFELITARRSF
jgi:hypothetical protein